MDAFKNFAQVTVSTGYDAAATSIVLQSGDGAKCPTAPANAVWWNITDYTNPALDPNVEIVRMTSRSTDTLTVTRAQESTSAVTHNTSAKTYAMIFGVTALALNSSVAVKDGANTYTTGAQDFTSATSLIVPIAAGYAPTANGSLGYDSTRDGWVAGGHGAATGFVPRCLYAARGSSDSITDDATGGSETAFVTSYTIPANFLTADRVLKVTYGITVNCGASPPTLQISLRLGGLGGTLVYQGNAASPTSAVQRGLLFSYYLHGTAAAGASVNVFTHPEGAVNWGAAAAVNSVNQPVAVATNASKAITLTAKWASNAANTHTITLDTMQVWEMYG